MIDEQFLKILREKLSKGSSSSTLLNCIPGTNLYKIDACELNVIEESIANEFTSKLLTEESFSHTISYQNISERDITDERKIQLEHLSKKLNRVYNDNELSFQEKGHRTFGFGYPIFIIEIEDSWVLKKVGAKEKEKRLIAAPLFIWPLEIQKSFKQSRTWTIKKTLDNSPTLNDSLISYIKQKYEIDLSKLLDPESDEFLNYTKLQKISSTIVNSINRYEKNNTDIFSTDQLIVPLRSKKDLQAKATSIGFLEWSGVFSLYSKQKQSLINELDLLINNKENFTLDDSNNEYTSPFKHSFSSIDTDHSQQNVIDQVKSGKQFVIQGPPGTGKSQTLTALITNALSNGAKCLVVCEKTTALDVIYSNLKDIGLEDLCALINDPTSKDRQVIVEKVRSAPILNHPPSSNIRFNNSVDELTEEIKEISKGYELLTTLIWEDQVWADMLGRFLKIKKIIPICPNKDLLKKIEWELTPVEYKKFCKILTTIQNLRKKNTSKYNEKLNKNLFLDDRKGLVKEKIEEIVKINLDILSEVQLKFLKLPEIFTSEATKYYSDILNSIKSELYNFTENYKHLEKLSPNLLKTSPLSFNDYLSKINTIFSSKAKRVSSYRSELVSIYQDVVKLNSKYNLLTFKFLKDIEYLTLEELNKSLNDYLNELLIFESQVKFLIIDIVENTLVKPEISKQLDLKIWENAEDELNNVISKINYSEVFEKRFIFKQSNYYKQMELITNLIDLMNNINNNLENFSTFYDYEKFYNSLELKEQSIIDIFIKPDTSESDNFKDIFDRFYLEKILLHNQNKDIINEGNKLELIYGKINELKKLVSQRIIAHFSEKQRESIRSFYEYKTLYNLRGAGGQRRNSLRQIVNRNFEFFTNFFPVILTNPTACSTLFPLKQNLFDIVIFDEASQLRIEDTFTSLLRGKSKIISGDQHQMPPPRQYELTNVDDEQDEQNDDDEIQESIVKNNITKSLANSESLLDYAMTIGYKKTHLLVHYRSNHPALINFSNNAFYSGNLLPIIKSENYTPITFFRVDSLYTERTNPQEADKVIEILNNQVDLKNDICPSVGVATFNIFQRDLIYDKINQRASIDSEFSEKLSKLNSKGFFVKNLENIQGDERDVIIMTTTFGYDKEKRFKKQFGPLGNTNGYRLLNVIITRAKQQFYICTSIPADEIQNYENLLKQKGKNDGVPIVLAYLAYAKAISENNITQVLHILDVVKSRSAEEKISVIKPIETESPFEEEVLDEMLRLIDNPNRIKSQQWIGSFRVDFLILPIDENRKPLIIECDGASYHGTSEAYAYDHFRMQQLRDNGYEVYRIWSSNWFDDLEFRNEIQSLKDILQKYDFPSIDSLFKK